MLGSRGGAPATVWSMTSATLKPASAVNTAPVTTAGLIGGWLSARESGIRPLGTVLLGVGLAWAARTWIARDVHNHVQNRFPRPRVTPRGTWPASIGPRVV